MKKSVIITASVSSTNRTATYQNVYKKTRSHRPSLDFLLIVILMRHDKSSAIIPILSNFSYFSAFFFFYTSSGACSTNKLIPDESNSN